MQFRWRRAGGNFLSRIDSVFLVIVLADALIYSVLKLPIVYLRLLDLYYMFLRFRFQDDLNVVGNPYSCDGL